jgi:hypothetical protein
MTLILHQFKQFMMKNLIKLSLFLLCYLSFNGTAQIVNYKMSPADSAHSAGNYRLAIDLYQMQGQKSVNGNLLNLANAYVSLGMPDSAIYYLKRQKELYKLPVMILALPDFMDLKGNKEWEMLSKELETEYLKENPGVNLEVFRTLCQINSSDQSVRGIRRDIRKKFGEISIQMDSINKKKNETDAQNLAKLEEIISKYGWPKISDYGNMLASVPFMVIQHTEDINIQKKYLKLIGELVLIDEADPRSFAYLKDRILVKENKKQLFGTQTFIDPKSGKEEVWPIEDEANVDKRRQEMGMGPLKDYLKMMGVEYGR